jgi:hypothetical protein
MKKLLLVCIILLTGVSSQAQTLICSNFCTSGMTLDTVNDELHVTIINSGSQDVNYPTVVVTNTAGDTVGNINNMFYLFQQSAGSTVTHTIPSTLTSLSGFTGTVYLTDQILDETCSMAYPVNCAIGISEFTATNSLNIYPNPASDKVVIGNLENGSMISVYDSRGKLLKNYSSLRSEFILNRDGLKNGLYLITVQNGNKIQTQKVIFE